MKKFIFKSMMFVLPALLSIPGFFYSTKEGDLSRMGFIIGLEGYRELFKTEFKRTVHYATTSKLHETKKRDFTVFTIGDSFSEQGSGGYQDYLTEIDTITVLDYDSKKEDNPITTLYGLINGDFFDSVRVQYIVLQSIERAILNRAEQTNKNKKIIYDSLSAANNKYHNWGTDARFFSDRGLKICFYNFLYLFNDRAFFLETCRIRIKKDLFSIGNKELLVYTGDIDNGNNENVEHRVSSLNRELTMLSQILKAKGIKLIVLISPDKYGLYYDYIVDTVTYEKPFFYTHFSVIPKEYLFVDAKTILANLIPHKKDIYFYDDTHWSPTSAKVLAEEIAFLIRHGN